MHLGARGQRCDQPAEEDGLCRKHGSVLPLWWPRLHRLAALLLLLAFLFVTFADFLRALVAWLPFP